MLSSREERLRMVLQELNALYMILLDRNPLSFGAFRRLKIR